jgi:hypothetical protein
MGTNVNEIRRPICFALRYKHKLYEQPSGMAGIDRAR